MTYNVFGGTLSLTQSVSQSVLECCSRRSLQLVVRIVFYVVD